MHICSKDFVWQGECIATVEVRVFALERDGFIQASKRAPCWLESRWAELRAQTLQASTAQAQTLENETLEKSSVEKRFRANWLLHSKSLTVTAQIYTNQLSGPTCFCVLSMAEQCIAVAPLPEVVFGKHCLLERFDIELWPRDSLRRALLHASPSFMRAHRVGELLLHNHLANTLILGALPCDAKTLHIGDADECRHCRKY